MMDISKQVSQQFKYSWAYLLLLGLTLLFYLLKGITYALIGSYIPFIFIAIILTLFAYTSKKSPKALRRMIVFWAVVLILWSSIRLLLSIVNFFIMPIPEAHVHAQLGIGGAVFSLIFLIIAIYLLKFKKRVFDKV